MRQRIRHMGNAKTATEPKGPAAVVNLRGNASLNQYSTGVQQHLPG